MMAMMMASERPPVGMRREGLMVVPASGVVGSSVGVGVRGAAEDVDGGGITSPWLLLVVGGGSVVVSGVGVSMATIEEEEEEEEEVGSG